MVQAVLTVVVLILVVGYAVFFAFWNPVIYPQPDHAHQRLPNDVAADLAETLGTTPENLRQIRSRAMKKIRTFLAAAEGAEIGAAQ